VKPDRIALFPLEVILFPGVLLPLHIFEPRYKLMIGRCLENHLEFGVILAKSEGIVPVGCTAEIVKLVKRYSDGRMDILTSGQTPYRVLELFDDQPYLEANVEFLDDDTRPGTASTEQKLLKLYEQCHTLIYGRPPQLPDPASTFSLAFQIAGELPLDLDYKQELLEMRVETERQASLLARMEEWFPQLVRLDQVRQRAGGNGHGLK